MKRFTKEVIERENREKGRESVCVYERERERGKERQTDRKI